MMTPLSFSSKINPNQSKVQETNHTIMGDNFKYKLKTLISLIHKLYTGYSQVVIILKMLPLPASVARLLKIFRI